MIYKKIIVSFMIGIIMLTTTIHSSDVPIVSAKSAIAIEYYTGEILYEKSAYSKMPMASTTKIMTALTVLKLEKNLNREFSIPKEATNIEGSAMYLEVGEILTIQELLYGLMLVSGNDCAKALAIAVCGNENTFIENMNVISREMGLKNTHFTNTSGLPDDNHYTTAFELAQIASKAMDDSKFREISSTKNKVITAKGTVKTHSLSNHNRMINMYDYCVGGKTGFTKKAGRCLVEIGEKDEKKVISVTLDAPDDWQDHKKMLEYGFNKISYVNEFEPGELKEKIDVVNGNKKNIEIINAELMQNIIINNKSAKYDKVIYCSKMLFAPLEKDETIGVVDLKINGKILSSSRLMLNESIDEIAKLTPFQKLLDSFISIIEFL